jgi:hypothetical protein
MLKRVADAFLSPVVALCPGGTATRCCQTHYTGSLAIVLLISAVTVPTYYASTPKFEVPI